MAAGLKVQFPDSTPRLAGRVYFAGRFGMQTLYSDLMAEFSRNSFTNAS